MSRNKAKAKKALTQEEASELVEALVACVGFIPYAPMVKELQALMREVAERHGVLSHGG